MCVRADGLSQVMSASTISHLGHETQIICPLIGRSRFSLGGTSLPTTSIARKEREIALMHEHRTRLTADLVTGKLDVREAPAEPTAEEALEEPELEEAK